jgi:cystathionine beta-lyase/cystathionine gamma-synthase
MDEKGDRPQEYARQTRLVHGDWKHTRVDYSHALRAPVSSSTTYSLNTSLFDGKSMAEFVLGLENPIPLPFYLYSRFDDPTCSLLEHALALAEGGESALTFASGMAAVTAALMAHLSAGNEILYHRAIYSGTHGLMTRWLPRCGIKTVPLDFNDRESLLGAISEETRIVYFETPVNPLVELVDIAATRRMVDQARERLGTSDQIRMIVDNTFPSPFCQRPFDHGADMVVCSLTKALGGFGVDMGGAVIGHKDAMGAVFMYREESGGILSPKAAWNILTFGIPTLAVRMKAMQESAGEVARFLEGQSRVRRVNYPGLASHPQNDVARRQMRDFNDGFAPGSMVYFELDTDDDSVIQKFTGTIADKSYCISLAVSLGHTSTLLENPYNCTHFLMPAEEKDVIGMKRSGMRLSLGLEDTGDIIRDLKLALDTAW